MNKNFLFSVFLLLQLFGCSTYFQIYDLKSSSKNIQLIDDSFIFENDTIIISYNFWGENGNLDFKIYNKLEKPIYIDWKRSSFIINSQKLDYWSEIELTSLNYFYKKSVKLEKITFIPPVSFYFNSQFFLLQQDDYVINYKKYNVTYESNDSTYSVFFNQENSPFKFRNFICFSLDEDFKNVFYINNEYFVNKITEINSKFRNRVIKVNNDKYKYLYKKNSSFFKEINNKNTIGRRKQ